MSGTGFGSLEHPYVEMPLAGYSASVHWGGGIAVQWRATHLVYIEPLTAVPNSPTGVFSVWVKFPPDTGPEHILYICNASLIGFSFSFGGGFDVGVPGKPAGSFTVYAEEDTEEINKLVWLQDSTAELNTHNKWYHVYAEWDMTAGSLLLKINGRTVATQMLQGFELVEYWGGVPLSVQWRTPADQARQLTSFFWTEAVALGAPDPVRYSIAELWLDRGRWNVGIDKFVDLLTGKPKRLGRNGEIPTGEKPAFYFARSGRPGTILENKGYGGEFIFAKAPGRTPLDPAVVLAEPEEPHFEPIPAAAAA